MPKVAAIALYLHTMSLSAVVVSAFWSVVNERFDPHTAKQLIGRIGGGATFGGVLGGVAVWFGASALDIPTMIAVLGLLNLLCAAGALQIGSGDSVRAASDDETAASAVAIFRESPYLRSLFLLVALGAFGQTVYDYVFKAGAAAYFDTGAELVSFFALFHLGVGVLTFLVQNLIAKRSLERYGLAVTVSTLPVSSAALGFTALLFPGFPSAISMRAGIGIVENSLFRSGYELLYTPVLPEKKRPTKPLIDVGGDKGGTALGGGFALLIIGVFPAFTAPLLIFAGIAASLASLYVARKLHHGYVSSLAERLRVGTLAVGDVPVDDATTRLTVMDTMIALERPVGGSDSTAASHDPIEGVDPDDIRERLVTHSASRNAQEDGRPIREPRPFTVPPARTLASDEIDATLVAIADLRSGETERILATLIAHNPVPRELVAHIIPTLGDADVGAAAADALRRVAPVYTGAFIDAVLRSRTPLPVRRRLCEILGRLPTQRSANGLIELLGDPNFELRFHAAANLLAVHRSNDKLRISRELLFGIAEREAADCRRRWRSQIALDRRLTRTVAVESSAGKRVVRGMTFIATLLLTLLEEKPLQLAIRALANDQTGHRGTGLEYLENVLPAPLLAELRPLLSDSRLTAAGQRSRSSVLAEIVGDTASGPVDFAALRAHIDAARRSSSEAPAKAPDSQ
jgi:hypothetical protein